MLVYLKEVTKASMATRPRNTFSTRCVYHLSSFLVNWTDSSLLCVWSVSLSLRSVALACSVSTYIQYYIYHTVQAAMSGGYRTGNSIVVN